MMAQTVYTTTSAIWGGYFLTPQDKRINRTGGIKEMNWGVRRVGTRYHQSENGVAIYGHSHICLRNLVNIGPQTEKIVVSIKILILGWTNLRSYFFFVCGPTFTKLSRHVWECIYRYMYLLGKTRSSRLSGYSGGRTRLVSDSYAPCQDF